MTRTPRTPEAPPRPAAEAVFDRILVGIDGTTAGFDACRQADRLATAESELEAASVTPLAAAGRERPVNALLVAAEKILGPHCRAQRLYGNFHEQLVAEAERLSATLIVVGAHAHRRAVESVSRHVAGELLHRAPCSVFVARPAPDLATFPHSVVVGVDGSEESELALEVAQLLAHRRHGTLQGVVAYGDEQGDVGETAHRSPRIENCEEAAVAALVEASTYADLVVVGSSGRRAASALGSVSECVADKAHSSVLVVRTGRDA